MSGDGDLPAAGPELSRPVPVGRIGAGLRFVVEATPAEAQALAARMRLDAVHSLVCRFDLRRCEAGAIAADGLLQARVRQTCVVTLDAFDAPVTEAFSLRFVPEGKESGELDIEGDDEVPYAGDTIDLGEAASEQLALALDPFPRKPGAILATPGEPPEPGAFAALSKLLPPH